MTVEVLIGARGRERALARWLVPLRREGEHYDRPDAELRKAPHP